MNLLKGSLQDELDLFFKHINRTKFEERFVSKAAFCKARSKLCHSTFFDMNKILVESFYSMFEYKTWHGFRLSAIDGSTLKLPSTNNIDAHFGRRIPSEVPQARISTWYDVLNKVSIEMKVEPWYSDERNLAHRHIESANHNDLILYDRGYPCFSLYAAHMLRNVQFVMRLAKNWSRETIDFENSSANERIIEIKAHRPETKLRCADNNVSTDPVKVRLIKVILPSGKNEILITSLTNKSIYPRKLFKDLYHLRWGIEEDYKLKKLWLEYENFSGKSSESVLQDLHAKVFTQNISAIIACGASSLVDKKNEGRKRKYQINKAQTLSKLKNNIYAFTQRNANILVSKLLKIFSETLEPIRAGRAEARNHRVHKRYFYSQYKTVR